MSIGFDKKTLNIAFLFLLLYDIGDEKREKAPKKAWKNYPKCRK